MTELRNWKITQDTGTGSHIRVGKFGKGRDPPTSGRCPFFLAGRKRDRSHLLPQPCSLAEEDAYTDRRAAMFPVSAGSQGSWEHF